MGLDLASLQHTGLRLKWPFLLWCPVLNLAPALKAPLDFCWTFAGFPAPLSQVRVGSRGTCPVISALVGHLGPGSLQVELILSTREVGNALMETPQLALFLWE